MALAELFLIAVGLSMDAFAVSVSLGLSLRRVSLKKAWIVGWYFGFFQALMPMIGYGLGSRFADRIAFLDHWIAFVLLVLIGGKMMKESRETHRAAGGSEPSLGWRPMLPLAIATSIDALAVGVTFSFLEVHIIPAVTFIGITTFSLSMLGVKIGHVFGSRYKSGAELLGGVILVCIGVKILLAHLGVFDF
ncbi:MAG: manganese efflux pump MntP family protein [Peptococcaceae bacterium]|nr:manganese efflux pump MntP family protein [Peptococcaceae bacterium]